MSDKTSIDEIKKAEKAAELEIEQAKAEAGEDVREIDEQMKARFSEIKDTLNNEKQALAEKVQAQAKKFRDQSTEELRQKLGSIESGADARINQAAASVVNSFTDYVSK